MGALRPVAVERIDNGRIIEIADVTVDDVYHLAHASRLNMVRDVAGAQRDAATTVVAEVLNVYFGWMIGCSGGCVDMRGIVWIFVLAVVPLRSKKVR